MPVRSEYCAKSRSGGQIGMIVPVFGGGGLPGSFPGLYRHARAGTRLRRPSLVACGGRPARSCRFRPQLVDTPSLTRPQSGSGQHGLTSEARGGVSEDTRRPLPKAALGVMRRSASRYEFKHVLLADAGVAGGDVCDLLDTDSLECLGKGSATCGDPVGHPLLPDRALQSALPVAGGR